MEEREPFRDRTLHLLDPRLFPTKESAVEFLRSDHFVALAHAIDRAMVAVDDDWDIPNELAEKMRTAASYAIEDVALLVSDAVRANVVVFDGDQDAWKSEPPKDRIETLCDLATVGAISGMTLAPELVELTQKHIDSFQGRELPGEGDDEEESEEPEDVDAKEAEQREREQRERHAYAAARLIARHPEGLNLLDGLCDLGAEEIAAANRNLFQAYAPDQPYVTRMGKVRLPKGASA